MLLLTLSVAPTVWVNFRKPGVLAPFATFTFVSRILEDCNSHMITLYVRSSGLCSLYIDFQERARFTIGVMSRAVQEAMERSAARASVPFAVADNIDRPPARNCAADVNGDGCCDDDPECDPYGPGLDNIDELTSTAHLGGSAMEFFGSRFGSITLSGWGITALASKETAFGSIPWSFDNIYVGESLEQARELFDDLFLPLARLEHKVPVCPYIERQ